MKRWLIRLICAVSIFTFGVSQVVVAASIQTKRPPAVAARPTGKVTLHYDQQMLNEAGTVIHRTSITLIDAFDALEKGQRRSGLALAVANQLKARELYFARLYQDAIFHAIRARNLAFQVIQANGGKPNPGLLLNAEEIKYTRLTPKADILDKKLNMALIGRDDQVVDMGMYLDI